MKYFNNGKVSRIDIALIRCAIIFLIKMTKIIGFLILIFSLGSFADGNAQQVSLQMKNKGLKEIFAEIRKQTGVYFLYEEPLLREAGPTSISVKGESLERVLKQLLDSKGIRYERKENSVLIVASREKNIVVQEKVRITGTVRDTSGMAMQGVSVQVKNNVQLATTTDVNGKFILDLAKDAVLVFRYVGYLSQEIVADKDRDLNVVMQADATGIEEVVIVGFGQQKKESLVSSVATIKGDQLRMPNRSLSNNLAGQIPGLIAVQRSGEPGYDNAEFWIRGVSSFAGGTRPLVLVDGVPRDMNDIEPDEIETFTLLKDAAATAIYGAEGANGVILITSKRGMVQRTVIAYRGEYSLLSPTRVPRFANSYEYLSLYNESLRNEGQLPAFSDEILAKYASGEDPDLYPSSNWWDILMRDQSYNTRHTLNFRGGGDRMRFFVSGAYFGESGLYKVNNNYNNNTGVKRYNLRSNVDIDVTKTTLIRVDLSGQYLQASFPGFSAANILERFSRIPPHLIPPIYSDGTLAAHPTQNENKVNPYNQLMESGYQKEWRTGIQSRIDLEQKLDVLTQGLKVRGTVSYDANSTYKMSRTKVPATFYANSRDDDGNLIFRQITNERPFGDPWPTNWGNKNIYLETAINYDRKFGKHDVNAMALYYQKEQQLHNEALAFRKQAYVGRAVYGYDGRYSIEANFGITGSENFAAGYRYGFFPAVGVAWNVAREPYFPKSWQDVVSTLKLRASIGRTGNDNTGGTRFMYRPTFAMPQWSGYSWGIGTTGPINGVGDGLIEDRFSSPFLSWEIEMKRNFGIDLTLWNGKVNLQADYFNNHRTDILLQRRVLLDVAGFRQAPWQNFGAVTNKGIDGSLNVNHQIGNVSLAARGNVTFARNKIVEYDEIPQLYPWMNVTGTRLNGISGVLMADGLYTDNDFIIGSDGSYTLRDGLPRANFISQVMPGDIRYLDLNGDGVIDDFDRVQDAAHPTIPELIYGFGLNVGWKGAYINVFFQGAGNVSLNMNSQSDTFMPFHWGVDESNVRREVLESRWTVENPSQDVFFPRLRSVEMGNTDTQSTWWVRDASFLRLKNVEVGYQFESSLLSRAKMKNARVYLMGQNVALWDKVKVFDPELGNSAGGTRYPLPSMWTFGLELTF